MREQFPLSPPPPSPSPSPSPASQVPPSSLVTSSHVTCSGVLGAWPTSHIPGDQRNIGNRFDPYDIPVLPNARDLEALDSPGDKYGAATTYESGLYSSFSAGRDDGSLPFKSNGSGYHSASGPHDEVHVYDLGSNHVTYGHAATVGQTSAAAFNPATKPHNHVGFGMTEEYTALAFPVSFDSSLRGIGHYASIADGLNRSAMSIAGAGEPSEKISCVYGGCTKTFSRTADLDRHVLNVHNRVGHHCQVQGCSNNKETAIVALTSSRSICGRNTG